MEKLPEENDVPRTPEGKIDLNALREKIEKEGPVDPVEQLKKLVEEGKLNPGDAHFRRQREGDKSGPSLEKLRQIIKDQENKKNNQ